MRGTVSLGGTWDLGFSDSLRGCPLHAQDFAPRPGGLTAAVPGEVHLDLMRQGVLDNIYVGENIYKARWVEESLWTYRRTFDLPPEASGAARIFLRFEGLDYMARIFLNGTQVGAHDNAFTPCAVEVTGHMRPCENVLAVVLDSGLFSGADKPIGPYRTANAAPDTLLHKRMWLRKPQSSFGWDWSPRLVNVGIHGDVKLEWDDGARVEASSIRAEVAEDYAKGTVYARAAVAANADVPAKATLTVFDGGMQVAEVTRLFTAKAGETELSIQAEVANPALWYPIGHGPQPLYTAVLRIEAGGAEVHKKRADVGFRSVVFDQSPHPVEGRYFRLFVNGVPVFCRGANLVPQDIIFAAVTPARQDALLSRALEAGMNFLRVWGGGVYESDYLYEACDRLGILVWQEFIFACATYPFTDRAFRENVEEEATYHVRRLSHHPSLIAWCGNNEIDWGVQRLTGGAQFPDYALYHFVLPGIVKKEDPGRYYQPSSPYSAFAPGEDTDISGDQHPWAVGIWDGDFWRYRDTCCRFPNEGGFMGPNGLATLRAFLPEGQRRLHSRAFAAHDNMFGDFSPGASPDEWIRRWMGRDTADMPLAEYAYVGGFLQGEALTEYITNFRRRKPDCASAIFWMYNDCWPCARSWTIVDYYGRRTPAFYPVARAFRPVIVVVSMEGEEVTIHGVNDGMEAWQGEMTYGIAGVEGYRARHTRAVTIPANASTVLEKFRWPEGDGRRGLFPFAWLSLNGNRVSAHRLLTERYHAYAWGEPCVTARMYAGGVELVADSFVPGVCLDLDGEETFSDNFFDLYPGEPYRVSTPFGWGPNAMRAFSPITVHSEMLTEEQEVTR